MTTDPTIHCPICAEFLATDGRCYGCETYEFINDPERRDEDRHALHREFLESLPPEWEY